MASILWISNEIDLLRTYFSPLSFEHKFKYSKLCRPLLKESKQTACEKLYFFILLEVYFKNNCLSILLNISVLQPQPKLFSYMATSKFTYHAASTKKKQKQNKKPEIRQLRIYLLIFPFLIFKILLPIFDIPPFLPSIQSVEAVCASLLAFHHSQDSKS